MTSSRFDSGWTSVEPQKPWTSLLYGSMNGPGLKTLLMNYFSNDWQSCNLLTARSEPFGSIALYITPIFPDPIALSGLKLLDASLSSIKFTLVTFPSNWEFCGSNNLPLWISTKLKFQPNLSHGCFFFKGCMIALFWSLFHLPFCVTCYTFVKTKTKLCVWSQLCVLFSYKTVQNEVLDSKPVDRGGLRIFFFFFSMMAIKKLKLYKI